MIDIVGVKMEARPQGREQPERCRQGESTKSQMTKAVKEKNEAELLLSWGKQVFLLLWLVVVMKEEVLGRSGLRVGGGW